MAKGTIIGGAGSGGAAGVALVVAYEAGQRDTLAALGVESVEQARAIIEAAWDLATSKGIRRGKLLALRKTLAALPPAARDGDAP